MIVLFSWRIHRRASILLLARFFRHLELDSQNTRHLHLRIPYHISFLNIRLDSFFFPQSSLWISFACPSPFYPHHHHHHPSPDSASCHTPYPWLALLNTRSHTAHLLFVPVRLNALQILTT